MKSIEEIEKTLKEIFNGLNSDDEEKLYQAAINNYGYEILSHEQEGNKIQLHFSVDDDNWGTDIFDREPSPPHQERKEKFFYYKILGNQISYEIGNNRQKEEFFSKNIDNINLQIFLDAFKRGNIEILMNVNNIKEAQCLLRNAPDELKIRKESNRLNELIKNYNNTLQLLEKTLTKQFPTLKINNLLLLLPKSSDIRAIQVASHIPGKEGSYRRSQPIHLYHQTASDGVEIILKNETDFSNSFPHNRNQFFLTAKREVVNQEAILLSVNERKLYIKKVDGQELMLDIARKENEKIITKIDNNVRLTNHESQLILNALKKQTGEIFVLKFELNKFGDQIVNLIAEQGETYNIGANASRIDKLIQYTSNQIYSVKNNKSIVALKDGVLVHKNEVVASLVARLKSKEFECLNVSDDQLKAKYPCLIVTFNHINIYDDARETIEIINLNHNPVLIPEGYSEFVTHMMIAQINLKLNAKNLSPLIDRRQSFGFLTPTLTDIHTGVRLSLGLTPNVEWINAVVAGIEETDIILQDFIFQKEGDKLLDKFRGGIFSGSGYKYLQSLYLKADADKSKEAIIRFISISNESTSKTLIPFITETTSEQYQKTIEIMFKKNLFPKYYIFNEKNNTITCYDKHEGKTREKIFEVDNDKINFFLSQNTFTETYIKLNEIQESWLLEAIKNAAPNFKPFLFISHDSYRTLYSKIISLYKKLLNQDEVILSKQVNLEKATRELINTQEQVVKFLLTQQPLTTEDTSDEDSDNEYAKNNYYSPAGMSALFAPFFAAKKIGLNGYENLPFPYSIDEYVYFELGLSWKRTLDNAAFIRSDSVEETIKNGIFKNLLKNDIYFNDKIKDDFFNKLINTAYTYKLEGQSVTKHSLIETANKILEWDYSNSNKNTIVAEEELEKACQIISDSFPSYLNSEDMQKITHPILYAIDNNPCVNKNTLKIKTAVEILNELCKKEIYPKIIVLDITSSTQEQIKEFLKEFNKQDKIPVLATASSMVKHSELGLDLWQGGENKVYLSEAAKNQDNVAYFIKFSRKFKELTQGTESGFGRYARRLIRETYQNMKNESTSPLNEKISSSRETFYDLKNELPSPIKAKTLRIDTKLTKGGGNCFFHAAFGSENDNRIEDQFHIQHRNILITKIKENIDYFLNEDNHTRLYLIHIIQDLWLTRWDNGADPEREQLDNIYKANTNQALVDRLRLAYQKFNKNDDTQIFDDFIKIIIQQDNNFFNRFRTAENKHSVHNNDKTCLISIRNEERCEALRIELNEKFSKEWKEFNENVDLIASRNNSIDATDFFNTKINEDALCKLCELSLDFFNQEGIYINYHFSLFMPFIFKEKFSEGFILKRKTEIVPVLEHYTCDGVITTNVDPTKAHIYYNGSDHYEQTASYTPNNHKILEGNNEATKKESTKLTSPLNNSHASMEKQKNLKASVTTLKNKATDDNQTGETSDVDKQRPSK